MVFFAITEIQAVYGLYIEESWPAAIISIVHSYGWNGFNEIRLIYYIEPIHELETMSVTRGWYNIVTTDFGKRYKIMPF